VKIGGGTGTAVLDDFLLCFRLDPILLSMMDLSTKRIMSMQIVIPGSALCLVTTGCVDVIELSTLVLTSFMVLASCLVGPLWLVVVIYVMSIIIVSLTTIMAYPMIGTSFHISALVVCVF